MTALDSAFMRDGDAYVLNPAHALLQKIRLGFAPPTDYTVAAFSDDTIILTSGPLAGTRWKTEFAEYQRGIMNAFHEEGVQIVVVMGSSQWGKTSILINLTAFHIKHDPCPILIVEPTLDPMAKDFARNRLEPVIAASPALSKTVSKKRAKDAGNTTLSKTFPGGAVTIAGANSAASLASRPIRFLGGDEIDRWPKELPGEGNTLAIAMKRTQTYRHRRRIFLTSSPTLMDAPIHTWYKRGDQRKFFVPCPNCDHMHPYEWKNVRWNNDSKDPSTARLHCPECDYAIDDGTRIALLAQGEWRSTCEEHPDPSIISFHLWEAYSPMSSLTEIVAGFLRAREIQKQGDHSEMHTWQNTTLGEPVEHHAGEGLEGHQVLQRVEACEDGVDVPAGACYLTMGIDVQDDRLEALVWAWGPGEESWLVDRHRLDGDTSQADVWALLDEVLEQQYVHACGQKLSIMSSCIDSAGHRTNLVYDYVAKKHGRRLFAIIGRDGQRPIVSSPSQKRWGRSQRQVPLYTIGVDAAKSLFLDRLGVTDKGPGYVHLPVRDWCDHELAEQLTSERLQKKFVKGIPHNTWVKIRPRNEGLDMTVYAIAALRLGNPKLQQMAANLAAIAVKANEKPAPATKPAAASKKAAARGRVKRSSYLGR